MNGKFGKPDELYFAYMDKLEKMSPPLRDLIYQFPVFVGSVNIARELFFYELYKKVLNLAGHIGEVGTYKGASFMLWAKLIKLFEPYNITQVYGFDWFEGMNPGEGDDIRHSGEYKADYQTLLNLIEWQGLEDITILEKMDVTKDLEQYVSDRPYLRFKLIFIDCGIKDVLEASLHAMWPRLVHGGVLILDHFNMGNSPSESDIMERYVEGRTILQMPFNRHSSGYVVK